jgi:hypothetical protein
LAVASLVSGLCALGPVALGLGIAALGRIRRTAHRGRGLAIAGIALGAVWTVLLGIASTAGFAAWQATRPLPTAISQPQTAYVGQLVTGNCLERLPPDGEVSTVRVVPCTESHAAQVITDYRFVAGSTWSGQDRADARVAGACQLTVAERDEGLRLVAWAPSEASWNRGDRTGLCLATIDGGGVTGSFLDGSVTFP